jgi:carbon monoxide dehydrogenase subunit G
MAKYTTSFHVDVPPAVAFAYMTDTTTTMPAMSKMELIHETPNKIGTVYRYEERFLGMRFTGLFVITEYVENKRIKGEFSGGLEEGSGTWTFKRAAGGTEITVEPDFRIRIPIIGPLATRLMMRTNRMTWIPALKKEMRRYAETHATKTAA